MIFSGFIKVTLLDYPEHIASTLFTAGCNFACQFCHNPELALKNSENYPIKFPWSDIKLYLEQRKNLLQGVCLTGGEPLIHDEILNIIQEIKNLGLEVKLDTNGSFPEKLEKIIGSLDYIAMDIKTSLDKYNTLTRVKNIEEKIKNSVQIIKNSNLNNYEFRTVMISDLINIKNFPDILDLLCINNNLPKKYYLAKFQNKNKLLDPEWQNKKAYSESEMQYFLELAQSRGIDCQLRINYQ